MSDRRERASPSYSHPRAEGDENVGMLANKLQDHPAIIAFNVKFRKHHEERRNRNGENCAEKFPTNWGCSLKLFAKEITPAKENFRGKIVQSLVDSRSHTFLVDFNALPDEIRQFCKTD